MKLGTENRNTVIVAAVLAAVALFMVWRTFFSGPGPVAASAPLTTAQPEAPANAGPAARRVVRDKRRPGTSQGQANVTASLDPRLRLDLLKGSEETEYKG